MITQTIDVAGYWTVRVLYGVNLEFGVEGFTKTNFDKKLSVVGIGKSMTVDNFFNTLSHEAKHVQSHICRYYKVPEDGEQAAYLMGFIMEKMFSKFKKFL